MEKAITFAPTALLLFVSYYGILRPYLRRTKGEFSIDDEMPYVGILGTVALVLLVITTVTLYYFDFGLGIEVTTEDIRHSLSVLFSASILLAFFLFSYRAFFIFNIKPSRLLDRLRASGQFF